MSLRRFKSPLRSSQDTPQPVPLPRISGDTPWSSGSVTGDADDKLTATGVRRSVSTEASRAGLGNSVSEQVLLARPDDTGSDSLGAVQCIDSLVEDSAMVESPSYLTADEELRFLKISTGSDALNP